MFSKANLKHKTPDTNNLLMRNKIKDYTDTKGKNSVAPNLELTKWMWKSYRRLKLTVNRLLNILVKVLDINDANYVIKTGDVTKNVARRSLAP